jgi:hypothetical protein
MISLLLHKQGNTQGECHVLLNYEAVADRLYGDLKMFSFDNVHEELSIMETHMQYDGLFAVIEC